MTSLIEDCQAWIDRGQESWKSYFSKWETFAEYEESLPESELIHEGSMNKSRERRCGNQKLLKLPLTRKGLKRVFIKNQQRNQKKLIKKEKSYQKGGAETKSHGQENLVEILENKQLEISLMTVFSDLLKANTNTYELFAVLFQTISGRGVTVKDPGPLLSSQQQLLFCSDNEHDNEKRVANHSFENLRPIAVSMPVNTVSLENSRALSKSKFRDSLNDRSICPPRNAYLQSLHENVQESNSKQMQSNLRQGQNPRIGTKDANNGSRNNFSKWQSSISDGSQAFILEKRSSLPYQADLFRTKSTKSIEFDSNHKFPKCFHQNIEYVRSPTISGLSINQENGRLKNLSLPLRRNRMSLSLDNANFITALKKLSEHKHLSKMPSQKRHSSKKLISDYNENDSDSDDQTKYCSPIIHCKSSKRLKADEQVIEGLEPDADDCQHIFDRVMKS